VEQGTPGAEAPVLVLRPNGPWFVLVDVAKGDGAVAASCWRSTALPSKGVLTAGLWIVWGCDPLGGRHNVGGGRH
jgi:hypothetical protein